MSDWLSSLLQYQGIPYLHQGHTREGVDCIGLVRLVWAEQLDVDLSPWDVPDRSYNPPARALIRGLDQCMTRYPQWGDRKVVVFRSWGGGPQTVGICAVSSVGNVLLHASRVSGFVELFDYNPSPDCPIYGYWG